MEHQTEPCASIPKTHVSLDLTWCHHHQAWTMTATVYDEDAAITTHDGSSTVVRFGPFDGQSDVLREASQWLAAGLRVRDHTST